MATRPYVPRADGESSIGVAGKKWGKIYAYDIDEKTNLGNNKSLGYRQPSNAQTVGDVRYHATLPTGWYLECTTAGTTGSGALTITSPTVGGTVSDGTVTWTIRKNASTQDLTGYLPLSGGAMTGEIIKANDYSSLSIRGSTSWENGAGLELFGKDNADAGNNGGNFQLYAKAGSLCRLVGTPTGILTWNGNYLDRSAVVAEALGTKIGYRKYASGLIVAWRNYDKGSWDNINPSTWAYPISFTTVPTVVITGYNHTVVLKEVTNTYCKALGQSGKASGVCFLVIGY